MDSPGRDAAVRWAYDVIIDPATVFLDSETSGLGQGAEICDLAIVDAHGVILFDSLIKPHRFIPAEATAVHGISDEDVADAPTWGEVYDQVRDLVNRRIVIIYNAPYDAGIINGVCRDLDLPEIAFGWQCAMLVFGAYEGTPGFRAGEFKWHRLTAAAAHFGIDSEGAHRALADTLLCRAVVMEMAGSVTAIPESGSL